MNRIVLILPVLACLSCACSGEGDKPASGKPDTTGTIVYEVAQTGGPSVLYAQSTTDGEPEALSDTWKIDDPCRPDISPDGRNVVFTARENGTLNIYLYDLTTGKVPQCLTGDYDVDCKDARFNADATGIIFSKGGQIALMDLPTKKTSVLTFDSSASNSQPAISADGKTVVFVSPFGSKTQLVRLDVESLSSSTFQPADQVSPGCPVFVGDKIVYEASGTGILVDGKTVFKLGRSPSPAFGDWAVYELGGEARIGNIVSGENYSLELGTLMSFLAFSPKQVAIATPEDGGREPGPSEGGNGDVITSDTNRPELKGRLVYHNYTSYDAMDSRMYIYDFSDNSLTEISKGWTTITHPMNAHFSADGKWIVFMGIGKATDSWDIFLWEIGSGKQPKNITPDGRYRDEDPKFSADGTKICFKRNEHLCEYIVRTDSFTQLTNGGNDSFGMPYYTVDGTKVLFGGGSGSGSYIGLYDLKTNTSKKLYDKANTVEYYPITIDADSFYYTQNYSPDNHADQLFKGYFDGRAARYLPFNKSNADYSDAFPVSSGWLFLVSTRAGGKGQYDLYIANEKSGSIYSLNAYNGRINTSLNELGPAYTTAR